MKYKKFSGWPQVASGAVVLFLLCGGLTPASHGQESPGPIEDHVTIAAHYRQEAVQMQEVIKRHRLSADIYRKGSEPAASGFNPQGRKQMVQHCERLIEHYAKAAQELEAMATVHETLAKSPPKTP